MALLMQDWVFRLGVVAAAHFQGKYLVKPFPMQCRAEQVWERLLPLDLNLQSGLSMISIVNSIFKAYLITIIKALDK